MLRGDFRVRLRDDPPLCGIAALLAWSGTADLRGRGLASLVLLFLLFLLILLILLFLLFLLFLLRWIVLGATNVIADARAAAENGGGTGARWEHQ